MTGSSFRKRWLSHLKDLRGHRHKNKGLTRAFAKYGKELIRFEILEVIDESSELFAKEVQWWDYFNDVGVNLYNGRPTGNGSVFHTTETIVAISKAANARAEADTSSRRNRLCKSCPNKLGKKNRRNLYCQECQGKSRKSSMRFEFDLVKRLYLEEGYTTKKLGAYFGISQQSAYRIVQDMKLLKPKHRDYKGSKS